MLTIGQEARLQADSWVHFQTMGQSVLDKWTKVRLSAVVPVVIESIGDDGWLIVIETTRKVRYKVWPTVLEGQ